MRIIGRTITTRHRATAALLAASFALTPVARAQYNNPFSYVPAPGSQSIPGTTTFRAPIQNVPAYNSNHLNLAAPPAPRNCTTIPMYGTGGYTTNCW